MTGADIEAAIADASPQVNPRLSEVDWDVVAAALGPSTASEECCQFACYEDEGCMCAGCAPSTASEPETALREALDEMAVDVISIFAEAAASIRGGVADAGREQCSREWAAQQVGYYASSAAGEAIGRFRRAALADTPASEPRP